MLLILFVVLNRRRSFLVTGGLCFLQQLINCEHGPGSDHALLLADAWRIKQHLNSS